MKDEIIISSVRNGELSRQAKDCLIAQINKCDGGRIIIKTNRFSSRRSLPQNSYFHLLMNMFKDELNNFGNSFSMQDVKDLCKAKFLLIDVVNESTGEIFGQRIKSTTELSKVEFMEFIDAIILWASELGIKLPLPNEPLQMFND